MKEKGKEISRGKQYCIWMCLLARRLLRQPAYIGLLLLIPLMGYGAGILERGGPGGAVAAVCVEEGAWKDGIVSLLQEQEADSVLHFAFCDSREEAERQVAAGDADCGFGIPADIGRKVSDGDWRRTVEVYETASSSITGMAKERIAGVIFRLYSEERFEEHMKQIFEAGDGAAMEAYETHLADGSTFGFRYFYNDQVSQDNSDMDVGTDNAVNAPVFPVKGVLAVLIFVAGMCGMLEYEKDRREKRFLRLASDALTYVVDVWISTLFVAAAALLCLWLSEGIRACGGGLSPGGIATVWSAGMWAKQIGSLLLYQGMVVGYCVLLRPLLHRQETIAAAIPILTLGSLVCAPVFIRLGTYLPVFTVLEKLFPVSYYLML